MLNVKNRAKSLLAADITSTDISLTVTTDEGVKFPASNFHITIEDEILLCSSRTTDTFTVERAKEGTTAAAHIAGKAVELRITAKIIEELQTELGLKATDADVLKKDGSVAITANWNIDGANTLFIDKTNGRVGIGLTGTTAILHLKAGTATANTAPLKFNSGTLLTTAEAGAIEFLTDAFYGTITTGGARKTFAFLESPSFITPALGTPSSGTLTNCTGLPTAGIVDAAVTLAKMANLAQDQFIGRVTASTGVPETATITAFGRSLIDDADADAARTTLGLGTIATQAANNVAITGGTIGGITSLGINYASPYAPIVVQLETADTNVIKTLQAFRLLTSGAPAAGFGGQLLFQLEKSDGVLASSSIDSVFTDTGVSTSKTDFVFSPTFNGLATERMRLTSAGVLTIGDSIELGHATDTTLSRSAAGVLAVEGIVIPSISSTNTLTNKRIQPRSLTADSAATLTPALATANVWQLTAQAEALTVAAPTGTPVLGEVIHILLKAATSARTITWNATYKAIGEALKTSISTTKRMEAICSYDGTDWLCSTTEEV